MVEDTHRVDTGANKLWLPAAIVVHALFEALLEVAAEILYVLTSLSASSIQVEVSLSGGAADSWAGRDDVCQSHTIILPSTGALSDDAWSDVQSVRVRLRQAEGETYRVNVSTRYVGLFSAFERGRVKEEVGRGGNWPFVARLSRQVTLSHRSMATNARQWQWPPMSRMYVFKRLRSHPIGPVTCTSRNF